MAERRPSRCSRSAAQRTRRRARAPAAPADVTALIREGQADGSVTDTDPPELLALSVVGTVGQFSHLHRTGRVTLSLDEMSDYVARLVARMLTANEEVARTSLAALRRGSAPATAAGA